MPLVLTTDSTIRCGHSGKVGVSSTTKLTINGAKVLLLTGVVGKSIQTCTNPTDNSGNKTCMTVVSAQGTATKLTAGNVPVVISGVSGPTDGVDAKPAPPPAPLKTTISASNPGQTILTAV